tara:strand:- start:342 stop:530 length:189 start_codon:yes stop_codon:yes gene_type:complete
MNKNNTLVRNIAAFTDALGVQNTALIWYLSTRVQWPDDDNRNDFIRLLTGFDPRQQAQREKV